MCDLAALRTFKGSEAHHQLPSTALSLSPVNTKYSPPAASGSRPCPHSHPVSSRAPGCSREESHRGLVLGHHCFTKSTRGSLCSSDQGLYGLVEAGYEFVSEKGTEMWLEAAVKNCRDRKTLQKFKCLHQVTLRKR